MPRAHFADRNALSPARKVVEIGKQIIRLFIREFSHPFFYANSN
jgi:hypothetical protein